YNRRFDMRKMGSIAIIIFMVIIAGCSGESKNDVYPLTGKEADKDATNRTVSVMVNNHPDARPQTGLSEADIVFEMLTEGNITRFLALFQSEQPEKVGPVRSAREYFFELAKGYDALYVYNGSAKKVEKLLQASVVDYNNLFMRDSSRVAPHNSYLLFESVYDKAEADGFNVENKQKPLTFLTEEDEVEGEDAQNIQINYATSGSPVVEFTYDETNESY